MEDVIIVGGGASGMVCAILAARRGCRVTILEHKDRLGKKILATGNGKCNYTNLVQEPQMYRSDNKEFPLKVLSLFDVNKTIDFFMELGVYPKNRNGYLYPNSEQASSVLQVLEMELKRLQVKVHLSVHVEKIHKKKNKFIITTNQGELIASNVVLSTGGCASKNLGSDGSGYELSKGFGHSIIKPLPALVQLVSKEKYFKTLQGVRCIGDVTLFSNGKELIHERGELLFANYGVSGIPIFQISRFAAKELDNRSKVWLVVDFLPEVSKVDTKELIEHRMRHNSTKSLEEMLVGLLNNKLAYVLLKQGNLACDKLCKTTTAKDIEIIVSNIKEFRIPITDTNPFEQAQVSAGGVNTKEIDPHTLESKLVEGLYIIGELLDVDGTCGGYNLQWAWSSGAVAAMGLGKEMR